MKLSSNGPIFEVWASHLGDVWASVNWLLRFSMEKQEPIFVSRHVRDMGGDWHDVGYMVQTIADLLESTGKLEIVSDYGERKLQDAEIWRSFYLETKCKWRGKQSNLCGTQWEGVSNPKGQNVTEEEAKMICSALEDIGFKHMVLGRPMSIEQIVEYLSRCRFFIGIDSGISHIAHSITGLPVFIIKELLS